MMKRPYLALAVLFAAIAAPIHQAQAITMGVNFVGGRNGPGGAGTVTIDAGLYSQFNWNNAVGAAGAIANPLSGAGGTAATNVSWTSPNTWAASGTVNPGNGGSSSMMSGYLDNFGGQNITVSGLATDFTNAGYQVIVYFGTDSAGTQGYTVADNAANTATRFGNQAGGANTNFPLLGLNGFVTSSETANNTTVAANAIVFTGLTGDSFTITGVNGAVGDGRARPTGFQVVSLDEPLNPNPISDGNIGINLAGGRGGNFGPHNVLDVAGAVPIGGWNNVAGVAQTSPDVFGQQLTDSTGSLTSARIFVDAGNTWDTGGPAATDNDRLMRSYIDNAAGSNVFRVVGLDEGVTQYGYDIIVYYDTDSNGVFAIGAADTDGNTDTRFAYENGNFAGTFLESLALSEAEAIALFDQGLTSNFVRLSGFTGDAFNLILANGNSNGDDRARISGIQIVANTIPEPASMTLLALAGAAILRRRRVA